MKIRAQYQKQLDEYAQRQEERVAGVRLERDGLRERVRGLSKSREKNKSEVIKLSEEKDELVKLTEELKKRVKEMEEVNA